MAYLEAKIWDTYCQGDKEKRQMLIEKYLPLVQRVVRRIGTPTPTSMDEHDLLGYGVLGLIDAIEKYDSNRGTEFETYATPRIKGAIIDELRKQYWAPRSVMDKINKVQNAASIMEQELGRKATEEEVAKRLNIPLSQMNDVLAHVNYLSFTHLEELLFSEGNIQIQDMLPDMAPTPADAIEKKMLIDVLAQALDKLPDAERTVLSLYYYEELTMKEIGQVLDVSESRVSQIRSRAILRLRTIIMEDDC